MNEIREHQDFPEVDETKTEYGLIWQDFRFGDKQIPKGGVTVRMEFKGKGAMAAAKHLADLLAKNDL